MTNDVELAQSLTGHVLPNGANDQEAVGLATELHGSCTVPCLLEATLDIGGVPRAVQHCTIIGYVNAACLLLFWITDVVCLFFGVLGFCRGQLIRRTYSNRGSDDKYDIMMIIGCYTLASTSGLHAAFAFRIGREIRRSRFTRREVVRLRFGAVVIAIALAVILALCVSWFVSLVPWLRAFAHEWLLVFASVVAVRLLICPRISVAALYLISCATLNDTLNAFVHSSSRALSASVVQESFKALRAKAQSTNNIWSTFLFVATGLDAVGFLLVLMGTRSDKYRQGATLTSAVARMLALLAVGLLLQLVPAALYNTNVDCAKKQLCDETAEDDAPPRLLATVLLLGRSPQIKFAGRIKITRGRLTTLAISMLMSKVLLPMLLGSPKDAPRERMTHYGSPHRECHADEVPAYVEQTTNPAFDKWTVACAPTCYMGKCNKGDRATDLPFDVGKSTKPACVLQELRTGIRRCALTCSLGQDRQVCGHQLEGVHQSVSSYCVEIKGSNDTGICLHIMAAADDEVYTHVKYSFEPGEWRLSPLL